MLFYFDFETFYSKTVSLSKMSLRRYLRSTHITATSWRIDDTPTQVQLGEPNEATIKALTDAFANPDCVVVGHNAFAFDIRVAHYLLGIDWPVRARDTLGMARAAWPNLLKSYSLDNLSTVVVGCPKKLKIDLHAGKHTQLELEEYVARDVDACAHIYKAALPRLPSHELELLELTGRSCRMSLEVNRELGVKALDQFAQIVHENATQAAKDLHAEDSVDYARIFGLDGKTIKSVKPAGIKALLIENLGFQTNSISIKKANPEKLRQAPDAGAVLRSVGKANAALSHKRRVGALMQDDVVDLNLSYAGSHTYRWTSTGTGKGVNFLNLPKHDKAVAKPIREMLSVQNMLLVRGDESALEYRMNGWLCSCEYIVNLFGKEIFADPYSEFGFAATGKRCGPKDPIRQVWKACVLGLGFLMGVRTHALNLARMLGAALAEAVVTGKPPKITIADLEQICKENGWRFPGGKYYNSVKTTTGLSETILTVAHFTHQLFHSVHPEMKKLADWLMICCEAVSRGCTAKDLDDLYRHSAAPKKERLHLELDKGMHGPSLAVSCGPWSPTLRWSNLGVRDTPFGPAMCAITTRGDRKVTPNIVIENVTQAAGRNAVALGMLVLSTEHGYNDQLNIHDELLLAIDHHVSESALCNNLIRARDAMIEVCSPGGVVSQMFDWAAVIDPKKITVSATLWDSDPDDICPDFWKRIEAHDYSVLDLLP